MCDGVKEGAPKPFKGRRGDENGARVNEGKKIKRGALARSLDPERKESTKTVPKMNRQAARSWLRF
jgi:hypothetical protein